MHIFIFDVSMTQSQTLFYANSQTHTKSQPKSQTQHRAHSRLENKLLMTKTQTRSKIQSKIQTQHLTCFSSFSYPQRLGLRVGHTEERAQHLDQEDDLAEDLIQCLEPGQSQTGQLLLAFLIICDAFQTKDQTQTYAQTQTKPRSESKTNPQSQSNKQNEYQSGV